MSWRRWTEAGLLLASVSALGFWGIVSAFSTSLDRAVASPVGKAKAPVEGEVVGRLEIPRLRLATVVREGVSEAILRVGSGHIPETPLPGRGNTGIAAHRDGAFRKLSGIAKGDRILVTAADGIRQYRVAFTSVVQPTETGLLAPTGGDTLTLVTCYPFHFVGPAPRRFVVRAVRDQLQ